MLRLLLVCFLLFPIALCAQHSAIPYARRAAVIVKLAPLWLIDADPALAGAVEIRTGSRTSVQGEFGYGRPGWGSLNSGPQHAGTWRMKAEIRFYRNRYRTNRPAKINVSTTYPLGNYQAIEVYAKVLNVNHSWYSYPPGVVPHDGFFGPNLGEFQQSLIRRNSLSLTYKVGRQFGWTDNAHQGTARFLWDVYAGLGVRLINQDNDSHWETPGYSVSFSGMFNRFQHNGFSVAPTLTAGIKLGFAL